MNPNVPEALARLILQLLAKRPEDRPQTAAEVTKRLRAVQEQLVAQSAPLASAAIASTSQPVVVHPAPEPPPVAAAMQITAGPEHASARLGADGVMPRGTATGDSVSRPAGRTETRTRGRDQRRAYITGGSGTPLDGAAPVFPAADGPGILLPMQATSLTLLDRLRQPDQTEVWNRFAQLYTPLLIVWGKSLGLQDADAADLAQDVLLKVMRLFPTYQRKTGETFRGWLFTVAKNECADFRRRRSTRPLPGPDGLSDVVESAVDVSDADYRAHLVHSALELIRPDFSAATWAAFAGLMLENRPAVEVAAATGLSPNAVYLARHRILTRLREELGDMLT